jgi:hypothetical protein
MKRLPFAIAGAVAFVLLAGSSLSYAQGVFEIPFKFKAGDKKFAAGNYRVAPKENGQIVLRKEPGGEEIPIPFLERLPQPEPPIQDLQLVFDVVGNFEPSYTEYVTEYVLAEFWQPGEQGYLIHTTKGGHQNKAIKGEKPK